MPGNEDNYLLLVLITSAGDCNLTAAGVVGCKLVMSSRASESRKRRRLFRFRQLTAVKSQWFYKVSSYWKQMVLTLIVGEINQRSGWNKEQPGRSNGDNQEKFQPGSSLTNETTAYDDPNANLENWSQLTFSPSFLPDDVHHRSKLARCQFVFFQGIGRFSKWCRFPVRMILRRRIGIRRLISAD